MSIPMVSELPPPWISSGLCERANSGTLLENSAEESATVHDNDR